MSVSCRRGWITIGVPIYRRLNYLPSVLEIVAKQDYPKVELLISDNGKNGNRVREMIPGNYRRLVRFRQNAETVDITTHFNQIIAEAEGEFFLMLNDDDEISLNFASGLVEMLEAHPDATLAYARQELINSEDVVIKVCERCLPEQLSGAEFIRAVWKRCAFGYENVESFVARRQALLAVGGYPNFTKGNHIDDGAVVRLCLQGAVVFNSECVFRHRIHEGGYGWQVSAGELAAACREFMKFLRGDPWIQKWASRNREEWKELKEILVRMSWNTYLWRWRDIYCTRMSLQRWIAAAFRMPFLPEYYKGVFRVLKERLKRFIKRHAGLAVEERGDFFARRPVALKINER